ncbi:hypothetical protein ACIRD9_04745 [Streptomyces violaceus]|uniref:hypothetical protein n=1 Tax=Streptomyces violaceus TaxID=1936 RepID=UPI003830CADA
MHGHLWSPSYFSASCCGAPPATVRHYSEQQNVRSKVPVRAVPKCVSSPASTPGPSRKIAGKVEPSSQTRWWFTDA